MHCSDFVALGLFMLKPFDYLFQIIRLLSCGKVLLLGIIQDIKYSY